MPFSAGVSSNNIDCDTCVFEVKNSTINNTAGAGVTIYGGINNFVNTYIYSYDNGISVAGEMKEINIEGGEIHASIGFGINFDNYSGILLSSQQSY